MLVLSIHMSSLARVDDFKGLFDLLEVRLKEDLSLEQEQQLLALKVPVLLTLENERLLARDWKLLPDIVDLSWDVSPAAIVTARAAFPNALLQGSYHSTGHRHEDFPLLLKDILEKGFDAAKIACATESTVEVISLLSFLKKYAGTARLTCVPMGETAQYGRVLAMTMGSYLSFCCLPGCPTAPGQIDIATMHAIYAASSISANTQRYALIGEHVAGSPSHRTHTKLMRTFGVDGLYVKIPVHKEEAAAVLPLLSSLGFSGLSITTPFKEMYGVSPTPVNTVKCNDAAIETANTDAPALIDALSQHLSLKGARVLLLGAGAVGMASAQALSAAGAELFVYNRTFAKACHLTSSVGGTPLAEETLQEKTHYDIVVNTTAAHFSSSFPQQLSTLPLSFWGVQLAAEFAFPSKTPFLQAAAAQGVRTISGTELWARQAAKQFRWWCNIDEEKAFDFLKEELSCRLQW